MQIAVFASIKLVNAEWLSVTQGEIRISSAWRVFEISPGDVGDAGIYGKPLVPEDKADLIADKKTRLTYARYPRPSLAPASQSCTNHPTLQISFS